jgi:hypothetical protein
MIGCSTGPARYGAIGGLIAALLSGAAHGAPKAQDSGAAQVTCTLEHPSLLKFEPVRLFVTLRNNSSSPIVLDDDSPGANATLRFTVDRGGDQRCSRFNRAPMVRRVEIAPGQSHRLMLDLSRWYDVAAVGHYGVTAELEWLDRLQAAPRVLFDVVPGIELQRISRPLPGYTDIDWTYSLRYWSRPHKGLRSESLFLTVDDEKEELNYGVFELGRLVRVNPPALVVDPHGLITVVHQTSQDCFVRTFLTASLNGISLVDQSYHLPNGDPYPYVEGEGSPWKHLRPATQPQVSPLRRWWRGLLKTEESAAAPSSVPGAERRVEPRPAERSSGR